MKVFVETYCDHGRTEPHGFELTNCPGGSREELLPNIEAAAAAMYDEDDSYDETWESEQDDIRNWYRRMARPTVAAALTLPGDTVTQDDIDKGLSIADVLETLVTPPGDSN